jgi:excisionase family DNA binding protein
MSQKAKKDEDVMSDLISQAEAARIRGVTRAAIRDLIRRGRLRSCSVGGRELVYRSEVENFEKVKPGPKVEES